MCVISLEWHAERSGQREKAGLRFFDIDGGNGADRAAVQTKFLQGVESELLQLLPGLALAAAHSEDNAAGNEMQRIVC